MTLRVGRLATRCRGPVALARGAAALIDGAARDRLPHELGAQLGPSLDREAEVVRLRRLDVTLRVEAATLTPGRLAELWARAVTRSLHAALARPDGDRATLRRFPSRAAYLAALIAHVLDGATPAVWAFPELRDAVGRPAPAIVIETLLADGPMAGDVLAALAAAGRLEAALGLLDEIALERLIRHLTEVAGMAPALTIAEIAAVGAAVALDGRGPAREGAAVRRQATGVWLRTGRTMPLRGIVQALHLLLQLLEDPSGRAAGARADGAASLPAWYEAARLAILRRQAGTADAVAALDRLRPLTPTAVVERPGASPAIWARSDCAGMLLLFGTIRRLGWGRLLRKPGTGPRVLQALIAGAGMHLLGPWTPGDAVEPAVALLAGMLGKGPHRRGIADALRPPPAEVLPALAVAADWPAALDLAADMLVRAFVTRIRGFRTASRPVAVRQFLRIPGRFLVEDEAVRVVIEPSPWAVALHLSGADATEEGVDWLAGRRVDYVLEGL